MGEAQGWDPSSRAAASGSQAGVGTRVDDSLSCGRRVPSGLPGAEQ